MKEQLDIGINIEDDKSVKKLMDDILSSIKQVTYADAELVDSKKQQINFLKKQKSLINDILSATDSTLRAQLKTVTEDGETKIGIVLEDTSLTKAKEKIKESLGVDIDITKFGDINNLIEQLSEDLGFTLKTEEGILSVKEDQLKVIKKQVSLINDVLKATGSEERAELNMVKSEDNEQTQVGIKLQSKKINQDKREVRGLEHLLRRYRWMQSLFLVTQNFISRMGESVKVFGAGLNLIFAPLSLLLNLLLIPALPVIAEFSKLLFSIALGFGEWYRSLGPLSTLISTGLFGAILLVMALPIAGFIATVLRGIVSVTNFILTLIASSYGMEAATASANALRLSLAGLAGVVLGGIVVWGLYETGVMDAVANAGKFVARHVYNAGVVFGNFLDYIIAWGTHLIAEATLIGLNFALALTKPLQDIPFFGDIIKPKIDSLKQSLADARIANDNEWKLWNENWAGLRQGIRIDEISPITAITPSDVLGLSSQSNTIPTTQTQNQTITNNYNTTINSSATDSEQLYLEFVEKLRRENVSRGAY